MTDKINPQHYKNEDTVKTLTLEPIDFLENLNFNLGNAFKYLIRRGNKPGSSFEEDTKKAIWYLEREIKRISSPEAVVRSYLRGTEYLYQCLEEKEIPKDIFEIWKRASIEPNESITDNSKEGYITYLQWLIKVLKKEIKDGI